MSTTAEIDDVDLFIGFNTHPILRRMVTHITLTPEMNLVQCLQHMQQICYVWARGKEDKNEGETVWL